MSCNKLNQKRFKADRYQIISGTRVIGDGYYEGYIEAFEGNLIEIMK